MSDTIDGIYAGYMTGAEGNGFSMFAFIDGVLSGVDPLGVLFDGVYEQQEDGYFATVKVTVPGGGTVIQGASAGPEGMIYSVSVQIPLDFEKREFMRVSTPLGPVNLRLRKLRAFGKAS